MIIALEKMLDVAKLIGMAEKCKTNIELAITYDETRHIG